MTAYTDFHYSPTGSGVISGAQVLEQTEQGINGLGQYVQDNVSGAIDTANQALTIAQTADSNATLALNTANSFASAISAANNTANNALTTAQSAQNTANTASSLATTANNNANTALNAANTATSNVATLTGTVNSLGNRMTAAENAISANAGNITTLQTNLQTTNNNVTAAANAASSAQATATSAQSTATLARNQAYVLRYTGTTITGGGTIAYADIDNTDNIKAGDKIIDATGAIYEIASVDIANQTATVGATEIINLAVLPDLFNSANTWSGSQTFTGNAFLESAYIRNTAIIPGSTPSSAQTITLTYAASGYATLSYARSVVYDSGVTTFEVAARNKFLNGALDTSGTYTESKLSVGLDATGQGYFAITGTVKNDLTPFANNTYNLGTSNLKWKSLNGINPGALSLPDTTREEPIDRTGWVYSYTTPNAYYPPEDGWLAVACSGSDYIQIDGNVGWGITLSKGYDGFCTGIIPVKKNVRVQIRIKETSSGSVVVRKASFYPGTGDPSFTVTPLNNS